MLSLVRTSSKLFVAAGIAFGILTLGACSGGGSIAPTGTGSAPQGPVTFAQASVPFSSAGAAVSLPAVAGFAESIVLTANDAPAGTNLQIEISSTTPDGMPALNPDMHVAQPFLFFTLSSSKTVSLHGIPGFTLTLPVGYTYTSLPVKMGYYDPAGGWKHVGNLTLAGNKVIFAPTTAALSMAASVKYYAMPYTCGGPSPSPSPSVSPRPSPSPSASPSPLYFVTDANSNALTAYPLNANGNVIPTRAIAGSNTGLGFPRRIIVDGAGRLYVANAPGASLPHSITVYGAAANGNASPLRTISGPHTGLTGVDGLDFDKSGNLYAANCGACFDSTGAQAILAFAPGASGDVAPLLTIEGSNTTLFGPTALTFDSSGNLLVSNSGTASILIFAPGSSGNVAPTATIGGANTGISDPECVVEDGSGFIYVCNAALNTITVYSPGATGNVTPIRTLAGSNTKLQGPTTVAFDAAGNLYVANSGANTITVYSKGASGNQAPLRTVGGSNTGLVTPIGLAFQP